LKLRNWEHKINQA